jgi:hypothetical protein
MCIAFTMAFLPWLPRFPQQSAPLAPAVAGEPSQAAEGAERGGLQTAVAVDASALFPHDAIAAPAASASPEEDHDVVAVDMRCSICCVGEKRVALHPCGHMFCRPCVDKVDRCPVCRQLKTGALSLYF